jgi:phospholipid/cholesterol/gamma-HCH transport system substrate-binding protein
MDTSYKQEVTVGALVILAIVIFIVGSTWLRGRSIGGDLEDYWRIQFRQAGNLKASSPVRVSGVTVGKVEHIELQDVGKVLIYVSLADRIQPRKDAAAQVVSVGFVGDAAVELDPGQSPVKLTKDQVIVGSQAAGLTDLAGKLGERADSVLLLAQNLLNEETATQLRETMRSLQGTLRSAQRTMDVYGNPDKGPSAELTRTLASLQAVSARFDTLFANPALERAIGQSDTLAANLSEMTAQFAVTGARLDSLLARANRGEGTIGKFATDSGLYRDMRDLSQSMKKLIDELSKNPGKIPVTVKIF